MTPEKFQESGILQTPKVLLWYKVYCSFMGLMYFCCLAGSVFVLFLALLNPEEFKGDDAIVMTIFSVFLIGLSLVLFLGYVAVFFLPRKPWVWIYGLVLIAISLTSACCMLAGIPLMIFWLKPEVKQYFGYK